MKNKLLLCLGLNLALGLILAGCSTIAPKPTISAEASPGPNGQHSGVYAVRFEADGSITAQLWYPQNRETFNTLVAKFGGEYAPPLKPDDHLSASYSVTGWTLAAALPKQVVAHPKPGLYWEADGTAIDNYIDLLRKNRPIK